MSFTADRIPKGWRYTALDGLVEFVFDYMHATSRGIESWVEVRASTESGAPRVYGRKDLTGANTVRDLARQWGESGGVAEETFRNLTNEIVYDVIRRWREGPEPVDLVQAAKVVQKRWMLRPWIELGAATRLIAAGGSSKSAFALGMALTIATGRNKILHGSAPTVTGPVAFLDWEANADTHKERLDAICRGAGIDLEPGLVHYFDMKEQGPLRRTSTSMAARFHDLGIVFAVVDSVMLARGSSGERGGAEDSTVDLYAAVGELGCSALLIDHKSAATLKARDKKGGYGSVVMDNSARLVWDIHQVAKLGGDRVRWTASNTKANNSALHADQSYEVVIKADRDDIWDTATFKPIASLTDGLADAGNQADQIELLLVEHGALPVAEIARHLEVSEGQVRAVVNRHPERFTRMPDTQPPLWMLRGFGPIDELPNPFERPGK